MQGLRWMLGTMLAVQAMAGPTISVQVRNDAVVPQRELGRALADAAWILAQAGVKVNWIECSVENCPEHRTEGTLNVSMLAVDPRARNSGGALGFAVLVGRANTAAIVWPRILSKAAENPSYSGGHILGSAIAHELGHLLLRSHRHGSGLMKANWERPDLEAITQRRLRFSPADARDLRAGSSSLRAAN